MIGGTGPVVRIYPDIHSLSRAAADTFQLLASNAVSERGRFTAALSGGGTPGELYSLLAEKPYCDQIEWTHAFLFWVDERCVPRAHEDSNYRLVSELLLSHIAIPGGNVHRIKAEYGAERAAEDYERDLRAFFGKNGFPAMDLVILGVGEDGHTASLFPGFPQVGETDRLAVPVFPGKERHDRVTLTLPVIDNAGQVLFLAAGTAKRNVIRSILAEGNPGGLPAGLVRPVMGNSMWYLDQDATGSCTDGGNDLE